MRNELQHIEQIERYLNLQMNANEKELFEQSLQTNPTLAKQVETQKLLMQATVRKAIKADIAKYGTTGGNFNWAKWTGIIGGVIVLLGLSYFAWFNNSIPGTNSNLEENTTTQANIPNPVVLSDTNHLDCIQNELSHEEVLDTISEESALKSKIYHYSEDTHCGGLKTWVAPHQQIIKIDPKKGKTIEGKEGTLIIVPTDAFLTKDGQIVTTEVTLELVEALKISDMIAYNLTTMNDQNALHSGGMIYLQPYANGKKVNINPERPLYVEIPTEDYHPEMKAWEGVIDSDGNINWQNPKDLEKYLTIVDFDLLNFLPEGFEEAVAAGIPFKSYQTADKELVDSLYYSLSFSHFNQLNMDSVQRDDDSLYSYDEVKNILGSTENLLGPESPKEGKFAFREWLEILFGKTYLKGKTTLIGHVEDQYGKRIPNARVQVLQKGYINKENILTDSKGYFTFNRLEDGDFKVFVSSIGYDNYTSSIFTSGKDETFTIESPLILNLSTSPPNGGKFGDSDFGSEQLAVNASKNGLKDNLQCYVSPQSIKTIKTENFAKTFLATKEFEDRIKVIHQMPGAQRIFDLYVNNLDKDLWEVDQLAAKLLSGSDQSIFNDFAAQKLTNVKNANIYQDQLSAYYNKKKKENEDAVLKSSKAYQQKSVSQLLKYQQQMNNLVSDYNALSYGNKSAGNLPNNNLSLSKVNSSKRLKFTIPTPSLGLNKKNVATAKNSYATKWYDSGWMNIDAYLHELSNGEKNIDIHVGQKGAKIYQCLNILKAVIPLTVSGIIAKAKFPKAGQPSATKMEKTFAIGIDRNQDGTLMYAEKHYNPYSNASITMEWKEVSADQLMDKLQQLDGPTSRLVSEIKAQEEMIKKQLEINAKKAVLKQEMDSIQAKIDSINENLAKERAFIASLEAVVNSCGIIDPTSLHSLPQFPNGSSEWQ